MDKLNKFDKKIINSKLESKVKNKLQLEVYAEIDSTNNQAKKFIKKYDQSENKLAADFFVFAADKQNTGRGRRGHSWKSGDSASLYVSFLVKAVSQLEKTPQITAAAALAVSKTLKEFDLENIIKWPNDIMVKNKKICGILSELVFKDKENSFVVIGCGLNLNNTNFELELKEIATSYYLEKGKKLNKNIVLANLIKNIYFYINQYFGTGREKIIKDWKKELALKGKKIDFEFKNQAYTAIIKDILDSGELLVKFDNGKEKKLQSINTSLDYQSLAKYNN